MSFDTNPRGWLTEQFAHVLMGGVKAIHYALSAPYRKRVREHWQRYPRMRWRGITRMILGSMLLFMVLAMIILVLQ